jgi:hypothetical protein
MESRIQSTGQLRKRYLPAVYLDPSFFCGYVAAAVAAERPHSTLTAGLPQLPVDEASAFTELVSRVRGETLGMTVVVSALTMLRWMQETAPLYLRVEHSEGMVGNREQSDFAALAYQSWLNRLLGDALEGVMQVDLQGMALRVEEVWEEVPGPALVDGPEHCTLHALAARHVSCTYVATTRPEMVRVCELLRASGGPRPLLGPRAVLDAAPASPSEG